MASDGWHFVVRRASNEATFGWLPLGPHFPTVRNTTCQCFRRASATPGPSAILCHRIEIVLTDRTLAQFSVSPMEFGEMIWALWQACQIVWPFSICQRMTYWLPCHKGLHADGNQVVSRMNGYCLRYQDLTGYVFIHVVRSQLRSLDFHCNDDCEQDFVVVFQGLRCTKWWFYDMFY